MSTANETNRNPEITNLLEEHIRAGDFPSAVYLIGEEWRIVFHRRSRSFRRRTLSRHQQARHDLRSRFADEAARHRLALRATHRARRVDARQLRFSLPARVRSHRQTDDHDPRAVDAHARDCLRGVRSICSRKTSPSVRRARSRISISNTNPARAWSTAISDSSRSAFCFRELPDIRSRTWRAPRSSSR